MKCNTDPILLKILAHLGCGFDCASQDEIQTILDLDVSTDRIIFANPIKQISFLKYAKNKGVYLMTFDDESELYKIKEHFPDAKCVLRIKTDDKNAFYPLSSKFGAEMNYAYKLIDLCFRLEIKLEGISFHVGCGQLCGKVFEESIENARKLFDYAFRNYKIQLNLLDIGGGFPGRVDTLDVFDKLANSINKSLDRNFPLEEFENLSIIGEPGTYYACSAFNLCVNIIGKRSRYLTDNQKIETKFKILKPISIESFSINENKYFMYHVNDGCFNSFSCLFDQNNNCLPITLVKNEKKEHELYKSVIWGPTCDAGDCILREIYLPELDIGDVLLFNNMGAYTTVCASVFNSMPLAKFIYIACESWDWINKLIN